MLNLNQEYSNLIGLDPNHTDSIQLIPDDLTNIVSIHDSANIFAIENILASLVHSLIHDSPIFLHGSASDPPSLFHASSTERLTPKGNPKPCDNPLNMETNVSADLDSDPSLSYSSLSDSSDSSDKEHYK